VNAAVAIYCRLQLTGTLVITQGRERVDGTLGNPAYLGAYLFFQVFLLASLLAKRELAGASDRARFAIAGLFLGGHIAIPSSSTVPAYLLCILGLAAASALLLPAARRESLPWPTFSWPIRTCCTGRGLEEASWVSSRGWR
jgi:hypothetical protein